ncbi:SDR family oxidoreductase [Actinomadura rudentiformis]|uniref:SDR family NAD(P)-dependent oxidoreductase n=1 Tax=Actinomadura rudentiformis TaxID=359158 RepID=A0A6H9Z374_9ACTN|nr:SDR family oxidoreductase [Actinomadura rudentiformis]KAB2352532.1 SDR family NAD(P)-dependent oxidoreductase [Actinomadura rudentiformis]
MKIKEVVVITGASSGIGRATALAFAGKGVAVVVAARREDALEKVAAECEERGAQAMAVPTDVSDPDAVVELGRQAVDRFGRIDVWVNGAAVSVYGPILDVPLDDFRRVLDVNVMGYVHGARVALRHMRDQGSGVLVNVSSITSFVPQPYATAYVMSKAAVSALSASLRQELQLTGDRKIKVCTVMPATIDTPLFQHAANYTGRRVVAMPPVYPAEHVAKTIVRLARRPRREVIVGRSGQVMRRQARKRPHVLERTAARLVDRTHLSREEPAPAMSGNLHVAPADTGSVTGGWEGKRRTAVRRLATASVVGAAAITAGRAMAAKR